jgi:general secretion pathway protein E
MRSDPLPTLAATPLLLDRRWPLARARHERLLLARGGPASAAEPQAPIRVLADAPLPAWRLEHLEALFDAPVLQSEVLPAALLDEQLAEAALRWRALPDAAQHSGGAASGADGDDGSSFPAGTPELGALAAADDEAPAVRLLDATLHDALREGASDVHLECTARGFELRLRLDGTMQPLSRFDSPELAAMLVSRLKVLAELDIGERRLPQDGRFRMRVGGRGVDFRLSVMPAVHGEDAVIRVLDRGQTGKGGAVRDLAALGFSGDESGVLKRLALRPQGLLLVTGPTGSGKTTTLYALLAETLAGSDKVVTIEDPVEVGLDGVVQVQVQERHGLSFARGLRSLLRHDPDRLLVGEIRDAETAQIAVQAALTGHGVLSSVHANGALEVLARFMHLGLDLYNLAGALNAVLAQRLVRVLCEHCAQPLPEAAARAWLADEAPAQADTPPRLRQPLGCLHCRGTGYKGRRVLSELLVLDDTLRDAIAERAPKSRLRALALATGWRPLSVAARDAVRHGITSVAEIERVLGDAP